MEIPVDSYSGKLKDYGTDGVMASTNEVSDVMLLDRMFDSLS